MKKFKIKLINGQEILEHTKEDYQLLAIELLDKFISQKIKENNLLDMEN